MDDLKAIPNELKCRRQWVCWSMGQNGKGKPTKIPYTAEGALASVSDPTSWCSFEEAYKAWRNKGFSGLGFVFTKDDPFCFIDLDDCINNGKVDPKALEIINKLHSYTEVSQSGHGIHIIVKAKIPKLGNRTDKFEIYDCKRYLCITGNILEQYSNIEDRQKEIEELCQTIFSKQTQLPAKKPTKFKFEDYEIIEKIKKSKQGDKFSKLFYNGDISGYKSGSEADWALVNMLAFYTQDEEQIKRIVAQSALWDQKWEEREDYQHRTINKALSQVIDTYKNNNSSQINDGFMKYFENKRFIPKLLADDITSQFRFIYVSGILYVYLDGVWQATGENLIRRLCRERLKTEARVARINEVIAHIQDLNLTQPEGLNCHKNLINLQNGMLDWRTGELLEHNCNYYSTIRIPVTYDPNADSSKITDWLESTLGDPELITLALELFGYCMIPDTSMSKAFMLVGSGANGKSTFIKVLEWFIGKDNVSKVPLQELSENRFKRAELFGKLVNVFADLDSKRLESTTYFKTIVSGDTIDAERKNRDPFSFTPFTRLVFSANEIPRSRDRSYAYYRRWCIIPFEKKFEGSNENKNILNELCNQQNMSALLNNALMALRQLFKRRSFSEPQKVKEAMTEYEKQNDPVRAFITECCQFDAGSKIERAELYNAFCRYCNDEGYKAVSRNYFYQCMRIYKEITEGRNQEGRFFEGIRLKS